MYSVLLMAAITGSTDIPACPRVRYCGPVYYAPVYSGCCGSVVIIINPSKDKTDDSTTDDSSSSAKDDDPMTEADIKALKALKVSDEDIAELKEKKTTHKQAQEKIKERNNQDGAQSRNRRAPATVFVRLPADAKLTFDDEPTTSTTDRRVFVSPALPPGRVFHYTLKAERMVDGVKQSVTAKVTVEAGRSSAITLDFAKADVAQK